MATVGSTFGVSARRNWWVRSRAWIGILIVAPFAILALVSQPISGRGTWGDFQFDVVAGMVFIAGAIVRWWATLYIGGRKTKMLVSDGPYSLCRNPLYVGSFLMGVSCAIFLQSLTFAVGFGLAAIFYLTVTVPAEEQSLRLKIGSEFDRYCERVPRFWPRWSNYHTPDIVEVNVRGLIAEMWRTCRWLWIPVLGELVEHLRGESWWPHFFNLP
jgi:protein-S-isoprenylcysteine O-methyltransferase Ste14